jgi:hypothetical protein
MVAPPEVFRTAVQAWRDVRAALPAMPVLTVAAFGFLAIDHAVQVLVRSDLPSRSSKDILFQLVTTLVLSFLLVPFFIGIHRFIILGETTGRYAIVPGAPRFQLFFAWSAAMQTFAMVVGALFLIPYSSVLLTAVSIAILVFAVVISVRLVLIFPAIAVDAPGATWQNSLRDTEGQFWRIIGIGLVTSLPLIVAVALLASVLGEIVLWATPAISTIITALAIAVASRLYLALGRHLNDDATTTPENA